MTKLFISLHTATEVTMRRPPGAREEAQLLDRCVACGDCVRVCPEGRLALAADGAPMVLGQSACLQCGLCSDVCSRDAIQLTRRTRAGLEMVHRLERMAGPESRSPDQKS